MAGICPLCGESIDPAPEAVHICKAIPMDSLGQCIECGTSLNDNNISGVYDYLCISCHQLTEGSKQDAIQLIFEWAYIRFALSGGRWRIWLYIASTDIKVLDMLRRTYGGRIHQHTRTLKWTVYAYVQLRVIGRDLKPLRPDISEAILGYGDLPTGAPRDAYVEELIERYGKCIRLTPSPVVQRIVPTIP